MRLTQFLSLDAANEYAAKVHENQDRRKDVVFASKDFSRDGGAGELLSRFADGREQRVWVTQERVLAGDLDLSGAPPAARGTLRIYRRRYDVFVLKTFASVADADAEEAREHAAGAASHHYDRGQKRKHPHPHHQPETLSLVYPDNASPLLRMGHTQHLHASYTELGPANKTAMEVFLEQTKPLAAARPEDKYHYANELQPAFTDHYGGMRAHGTTRKTELAFEFVPPEGCEAWPFLHLKVLVKSTELTGPIELGDVITDPVGDRKRRRVKESAREVKREAARDVKVGASREVKMDVSLEKKDPAAEVKKEASPGAKKDLAREVIWIEID